MEKVNFGAVSLRDYVKDFGLDVDDFLEFISGHVTWGDEAVKYVLLDPLYVEAWLSDFMVSVNKSEEARKIVCMTHVLWVKNNEVAFFYL